MPTQLWLPSFYSSGMVLQQQVTTLLRGSAQPLATINLTIDRRPFDNRSVSPLDTSYGRVHSAETVADDQGSFVLSIPPFNASFDPFTVTLTSGRTSLTLSDVLFGEVWITAGQSNMQMPLAACQDHAQLASLANLYYVRVLVQPADALPDKKSIYSYEPQKDIIGAAWLRGDQPEQIAGVSAIGFSFVRELHLDLKIPVGLIDTALRGTHIHAWLSRESIEKSSLLKSHIEQLGCYRDEKDWNLTGDRVWARNQPSALYNNKIAPMRGLGARGLIWHHGESDYQYPDYYRKALRSLLADWQTIFRPVDPRGLAMLIVQLKPHFHGHYRFEQQAEFNEMLAAVRHTLTVPSAIIPIYDLPPDYADAPPDWRSPRHATSKLPIGQRLKTAALGLLYQRKAPASAPECSNIEIVGGKMMLSFSNIGDGLRLNGDDTRLRGFTICGPDRIFREAQARILYGLKVLVWHDKVDDPQAVTYAHADLNGFANLVSRDHLPVVPFRSDCEPSDYSPPMEWIHCDNLQIWCCPHYDQPEETGWHPAWLTDSRYGEIRLEKANKAEGDASLYFRYQESNRSEFSVEPQINYDSLFPPLNLTAFSQLSVDIFNPDQQIKHLRLAAAAGSAEAELHTLSGRITILPALRWQRLQVDLTQQAPEQRAQIRRLVFIIEDRKGKGSVYIDNVQFR